MHPTQSAKEVKGGFLQSSPLSNEPGPKEVLWLKLATLIACATYLYWSPRDESKLSQRQLAEKVRTNSVDFRMGCPWLYMKESLTRWKVVSKDDLEEGILGIAGWVLALSLIVSVAQCVLKNPPKQIQMLALNSYGGYLGLGLAGVKLLSYQVYKKA